MKSKNLGGINKLALLAGSVTVFTVASLVNFDLKTPKSQVLGEKVDNPISSCEQKCKAESVLPDFDTSDGYDYKDCVGQYNGNIKKTSDVKKYLKKEIQYSVTKKSYDAKAVLTNREQTAIESRENIFMKEIDGGQLTKQQVVEKFCDINNLNKNKSSYLALKKTQEAKVNKCILSCKKTEVNSKDVKKVVPVKTYADVKIERMELEEAEAEAQKKPRTTSVVEKVRTFFSGYR